jgi:arylsulfatase A-like enzyme
MSRRVYPWCWIVLVVLALGVGWSRTVAAQKEAGAPPNVVFILADDLGGRDTSLYGSRFCETPNLERLARRGMTFSQAYAANPLCSPTRASLMTGLYPARIGITQASGHVPEEVFEATLARNGRPDQKVLQVRAASRLKHEYFTLAEAFKQAGYGTGHFGKWHLGREPYDPLHQGFDVDVPHWWGPGPARSYLAPWAFPNFQGQPGEHIEDRTAAEAVKFLREHRDRPFFLNYWAFSVHGPWGGKPELIEKYRKKADPKSAQRNPVYGAMVQSLDEAIGTLTGALDELGLAERTIVIFSSDNGGVHFREVDGVPVTSNAPLRGGKATLYEGGTRVPGVIVWPGTVKAGTKSDAVISSVDYYPTLLEMTGLKPQPGQRFDGVSIVPALKGRRLERETIFCYFPHYTPATGNRPGVWVRKGDWKLIRYFGDNDDRSDRLELYDLKEDLAEANNLSTKQPERVRGLNALIDQFLKETGAVVPVPNPNYHPAAG